MKRNIAGFFRYARSRHQVYLNRMAGVPREKWTRDPILQKYRFTNVFRELDKTTVWFREHVRHPLREDPSVLLATVVFRLLNRIEVGEAIWGQMDIEYESAFAAFVATGRIAHLRKAIRANCGDGPYVTGAYIISSPAGVSKLDGVLSVIKNFYDGSAPVADTMMGNKLKFNWRTMAGAMLGPANGGSMRLELAWDWLRQFDYFGPFHAYEIVTDLRHTSLLRDAPDIMTWANPGPGAHRGANRVFRGDKSARVPRQQVIDEMRVLLSWSRDAKHWPQADTASCGDGAFEDRQRCTVERDWPAWEMRDVEHTLCEFDKYERVRLGEGKPRGVYR